MPLARLHRQSDSARNRAVSREAFVDRSEPAFADGRDDDQRRRLRHRLVRTTRRGSVHLSLRESRLERPQPARGRACDSLAALCRARALGDRHARAGNQLPSVSPRPLAVRSQRPDPPLSHAAARPDDAHRSRAVRVDRRIDGFRSHVPSRAHVRARARSARRARTDGGRDRGRGRASPRRRAAQHDGLRDGRRAGRRGALLERTRFALALSQHVVSPSARTLPARSAHPRIRAIGDDAFLVLSEPLVDLHDAWEKIPESTAIIARRGDIRQVPFQPRRST
ncbi:YafJ [Burkholderia pseudomallei]|nr:YafJ [Burkholderia pseudomallei]